ncbi:MAG: ureidoglycolate lyase [Pseudomonadota bacterium]|nr:ureidoglycolate lyase [Pseudomonadota bacterium]
MKPPVDDECVLRPQPLTASAFAPYGDVLAAAGAAQAINAGTSLRFDLPAPRLAGQDGHAALALFRAQAQRPEGPWRVLERHRLGTQSFVPLMGARCIVLVARGDAAPDVATLAAFEVAGHQGFTLHAGCWHHPLIALDAGDFIVLERGAAAADCELVPLARPVRLARG